MSLSRSTTPTSANSKRIKRYPFFWRLRISHFDESDPERVRAWISSSVPVKGVTELEVGSVVFKLSGHEYRQELTIVRPGNPFDF